MKTGLVAMVDEVVYSHLRAKYLEISPSSAEFWEKVIDLPIGRDAEHPQTFIISSLEAGSMIRAIGYHLQAPYNGGDREWRNTLDDVKSLIKHESAGFNSENCSEFGQFDIATTVVRIIEESMGKS